MKNQFHLSRIALIGGWLFFTAVIPQLAMADHGYGSKGCPTCPYGGEQGGGLEEKFFQKAHFMMENQEELGLTETQINDIKSLKMNVKKMVIRQDAEIDIVALDVKSKLHDYPVDGKALESLINQKYELKKAKAVQLAQAYTQLKNSLSQEQYQKMKDLWKKQ